MFLFGGPDGNVHQAGVAMASSNLQLSMGHPLIRGIRKEEVHILRLAHRVKDRVNPATRIGFKTSHFEEQTVCCKDFLKSIRLRFREVRYGKPTQDGCGACNIDAREVGLVTTTDRPGAGGRSRDGGPARPLAAGGFKTSHEPDPRVGANPRGDPRVATDPEPDPRVCGGWTVV
jgi:hypothetical protein